MKYPKIRDKWQDETTFRLAKHVRIIVPEKALKTVFDECDRFDRDETGGRIIGTFAERGEDLTLRVNGIIEPGPNAQRSAVSFLQDGHYQESVFREIEGRHPETEHLGNWHTHHCNGLSHLSGGDLDTYGRIVNHHNHNTDFFYALLVVARRESRDPVRRYSVKHYIFQRGDDRVYEVPDRFVEIVDAPLVWPLDVMTEGETISTLRTPPRQGKSDAGGSIETLGAKQQRAYDREILAELYHGIRPFASAKLGLYWRGPIELLDGSKTEVVVVEKPSDPPSYSVVLRDVPDVIKEVAEKLASREFPSAAGALLTVERACNRALIEKREPAHKDKKT